VAYASSKVKITTRGLLNLDLDLVLAIDFTDRRVSIGSCSDSDARVDPNHAGCCSRMSWADKKGGKRVWCWTLGPDQMAVGK